MSQPVDAAMNTMHATVKSRALEQLYRHSVSMEKALCKAPVTDSLHEICLVVYVSRASWSARQKTYL